MMQNSADVDAIRDRNVIYRLLDDGRVENVYNVKILNKTEHAHRFVVTCGRATRADARSTRMRASMSRAVACSRRGSCAPQAGLMSRWSRRTSSWWCRPKHDPRLQAATTARFRAPTK